MLSNSYTHCTNHIYTEWPWYFMRPQGYGQRLKENYLISFSRVFYAKSKSIFFIASDKRSNTFQKDTNWNLKRLRTYIDWLQNEPEENSFRANPFSMVIVLQNKYKYISVEILRVFCIYSVWNYAINSKNTILNWFLINR